jgi:hypothetical protein
MIPEKIQYPFRAIDELTALTETINPKLLLPEYDCKIKIDLCRKWQVVHYSEVDSCTYVIKSTALR